MEVTSQPKKVLRRSHKKRAYVRLKEKKKTILEGPTQVSNKSIVRGKGMFIFQSMI